MSILRKADDNPGCQSKTRLFVQIADIGDVRANLYNLTSMADEVTKQYEQIFRCYIVSLTSLESDKFFTTL